MKNRARPPASPSTRGPPSSTGGPPGPTAEAISRRFADPDRQALIGPLDVKISGCINACGHHHVGHIGILGLERKGVETYQLTLGGSGDEGCTLGDITGPGFSVPSAISSSRNHYQSLAVPAGERCQSQSLNVILNWPELAKKSRETPRPAH